MGVRDKITETASGALAGYGVGGWPGAIVGGGVALANSFGAAPGQGGFDLQQDALNDQMNLSNSLMNMGEEQFGQESPYRANMLRTLQDRSNAQLPAYTPNAPTMYNPYQNTYRVAPTHGPASAPRGHEGFTGGPAYAQAQAPQTSMSMYNPGGREQDVIPSAGAGGSQPVGDALEEKYKSRAAGDGGGDTLRTNFPIEVSGSGSGSGSGFGGFNSKDVGLWAQDVEDWGRQKFPGGWKDTPQQQHSGYRNTGDDSVLVGGLNQTSNRYGTTMSGPGGRGGLTRPEGDMGLTGEDVVKIIERERGGPDRLGQPGSVFSFGGHFPGGDVRTRSLSDEEIDSYRESRASVEGSAMYPMFEVGGPKGVREIIAWQHSTGLPDDREMGNVFWSEVANHYQRGGIPAVQEWWDRRNQEAIDADPSLLGPEGPSKEESERAWQARSRQSFGGNVAKTKKLRTKKNKETK